VSKARTISVIDDDESIRRALKGLIRSLGYDAATFATAEEYLDSEDLQDTLCLITDIHMPGISGIELQERLIKGGHRTKIIFITGVHDDSLRTRALEAGAVGFLKKPFDDDCLVKYLDKALKATGDTAG
jgi:FixJ family two-component response regulator